MNIEFGRFGIGIHCNRRETVCPEHWVNCFSPPKPIGSVQSSLHSCHHATHGYWNQPICCPMLTEYQQALEKRWRWDNSLFWFFVFLWALSVSQLRSRDELIHFKPRAIRIIGGDLRKYHVTCTLRTTPRYLREDSQVFIMYGRLLDMVRARFTAIYSPSSSLSVDEAMIPFKSGFHTYVLTLTVCLLFSFPGRSAMMQYLPKKNYTEGVEGVGNWR